MVISYVRMRRSMLALLTVAVACAPTDEAVVTTQAPTSQTTTTVGVSGTTAPAPETDTTPGEAPTTTATTLPPLLAVAYQEVHRLAFPIGMAAVEDATYLGLKGGQVYRMEGDDLVPVLDISSLVRNQGEQGFLGMDLHPDDPTRLYVHYSAGDGATTVAEYDISQPLPDPAAGRLLLRVGQPAGNHNGGMLQFGPDGALYLGLGDGGGAGDRFGHGQNTGTLLGALVRLEPDGDPNPVLHGYGLRNPWRFWIDDDLIYIADVGQNRVEEVNVVPISESGHNFGWSDMEGDECFAVSNCNPDDYTSPVVTYRNPGEGCSVTGGVVYRGSDIPELDGHYFYSDYCAGWLRSFLYQDGQALEQTDWTDQVGVPGRVVSFGVDHEGDMYVMTENALLKVVPVR